VRALVKLTEPEVLARKGSKWTAEYVAASADARKTLERWGNTEIKAVLAAETGRRCAYCEGISEDVAYPHVEHLIPKSVKPEMAHIWENLTYCCEACNKAKGNYYSPTLPIINPYTDAIEGHLSFLGNLVTPGLGSDIGEVSIKKLKLNRMQLCNSRKTRIESVHPTLLRKAEVS
jgi:5-methylcytosine-specific restriction endonuclease McrA